MKGSGGRGGVANGGEKVLMARKTGGRGDFVRTTCRKLDKPPAVINLTYSITFTFQGRAYSTKNL